MRPILILTVIAAFIVGCNGEDTAVGCDEVLLQGISSSVLSVETVAVPTTVLSVQSVIPTAVTTVSHPVCTSGTCGLNARATVSTRSSVNVCGRSRVRVRAFGGRRFRVFGGGRSRAVSSSGGLFGFGILGGSRAVSVSRF